jgi:hypothetical protein
MTASSQPIGLNWQDKPVLTQSIVLELRENRLDNLAEEAGVRQVPRAWLLAKLLKLKGCNVRYL